MTVISVVSLFEQGAVELAASTSVKLLNAFDDLSNQVPEENVVSPGLASRVAEIVYLVVRLTS